MASVKIPKEAVQALSVLQELFGGAVVAVYLYGSAVMGGLRDNSDVDVMAVVNRGLSGSDRRILADRLMRISGKMGNADSVRPLEVTVINQADVVPWRYPPKKEFIYGEWLRGQYEQGSIPEPEADPDLAILLYQVRSSSLPLFGGKASDILDPVPMADVFTAMRDCLPSLMAWLKGDERNVILTLARMWVTAADSKIVSKDEAAEWAMIRLPKEQAKLLGLAGKAYRGEYVDHWEGLEAEAMELAQQMKKEIEACLDHGR